MNENDIEIIDVDTSNNPESNSTVIYESDNMNNKPKKSKKKLFLIVLILLIIAAGLFVYLEKDVLFGKSNNTNNQNNNASENNNSNSNENNNNQQTDNKKTELSSADKKKILDIIGLTENGYPRMDRETIKSLDLVGTEYIDYNIFNIATHFINLDVGTHTINDLDAESFNYFLMDVCKNKTLISKIDTEPDNPCNDSGESCFGISESEYLKISKIYSIDSNKTSTLKKYKGYYLMNGFGTLLNPAKVTDSLEFSYDNGDVIVIYIINKSSINNDEINNPSINKKIEYKFKASDEGSYYLYNFIVTKL